MNKTLFQHIKAFTNFSFEFDTREEASAVVCSICFYVLIKAHLITTTILTNYKIMIITKYKWHVHLRKNKKVSKTQQIFCIDNVPS